MLAHYGVELILADVHERLSEEQILAYAGQFDGTLCGDDRYTERALQACLPRLKVLSKWGTGIDSIDRAAAQRLGIQVRNTPNAFTLPGLRQRDGLYADLCPPPALDGPRGEKPASGTSCPGAR